MQFSLKKISCVI